VKRNPHPVLALFIALFVAATSTAQQAFKDTVNTAAVPTIINSLSSLPEADALIYVNPQRILNEALPKFMAEKDLADMRQIFAQVKGFAGVDPSKVEYLVVALRFRKPTGVLQFNAPEFMVATGGDFSSESLLTIARLAAGDKLREEAHGGQKLSVMTIDPILKQAEKTPFLKSFSEVAVAAVTPTMIAVGSPGYIRAALDAAVGGAGRITPTTLNSLLRDPNALLSAAGSPWASFSKSFGLLGTEAAERAARCETQLGDFYLGVTMDASNIVLRGFMNADNPDTAKILNNLIVGLLAQASSVPDANAQMALKALSFTAENDEIVVRADVPHQKVLEIIKQQTSKKEEAKVTEPAKKKRSTPVRRKRRRP